MATHRSTRRHHRGLIYGLEAAEFLVKRGRKVIVVEESDELGTKILDAHRPKLLAWLARKGTTMLTGVKFDEITARGLVIYQNGRQQLIEADTILAAIPRSRTLNSWRNCTRKVRKFIRLAIARTQG